MGKIPNEFPLREIRPEDMEQFDHEDSQSDEEVEPYVVPHCGVNGCNEQAFLINNLAVACGLHGTCLCENHYDQSLQMGFVHVLLGDLQYPDHHFILACVDCVTEGTIPITPVQALSRRV